MTDYKGLCRELVWLDQAEPGDYADWRQAWNAAIERARAALAESEPDGLPIWTEGICGDGAALLRDGVMVPIEEVVRELNRGAQARAVLARWGNHPESPDSSLQPVPVSERLPGPGDCDAEGECYWFDPEGSGAWYQDTYQGNYSHWLPAHALPQPS